MDMRIGRILTLLTLLLAPALVRAQDGGVEVDYNHPQKYIIAGISVEGNTLILMAQNELYLTTLRQFYSNIVAECVNKANMAQLAFASVFGEGIGSLFVAICLLFFAFSTILSWNFFGKVNLQYLFGKKAIPVYSVLALVFIFLGSLLSNDLVWELADMFNQLMVIPNVIALITLSALVAKAARTK